METLTEKCSGAWHELWQRPQYLLAGRSGMMMGMGHEVMPMVFLRISDAVESAIQRRIRAQDEPRHIDLLGEMRQAAYMKVSDCQTIDSIVYGRLSMPLINQRITVVEPLKAAIRKGS